MLSGAKSRFYCMVALLLVMSGPVCRCFAQEQDKVVAIINKDIITRKDMYDFLNFMVLQLSSKFSPQEVQERLEAAKDDILNRLIEDKLILQEAKAAKVYVDENRVKGKIEQMKSQFPSIKDYNDSLAAQGLTPADVENKIREQLMIYSVIETKVKDKITVEPGEVTAFYQAHASEIAESEGRRVKSVILESEGTAQQVAASIKKGSSFEDAAKEVGAEVQDLGVVHRGQSRKEIEDAIFNLKVGEYSSVVKLESNRYFILRLEEIIPPKQISLDEARDKIAAILFEEKMQKGLTKWIDELKVKYYVEIKKD